MALNLYQQTDDRLSPVNVSDYIGITYRLLGDYSKALLYYKDNQALEQELQVSYITKIENTYRFLAHLRVEQGRTPEAQQVFDLLEN